MLNRNIRLIIEREFNARVRKRSFIITTILTPVFFAIMMTLPAIIASSSLNRSNASRILVLDQSNIVSSLVSSEFIEYEYLSDTDRDGAKDRLLGDDSILAFLYVGSDISSNPSDVSLYSYRAIPMDVEREVSQQLNDILYNYKVSICQVEGIEEILSDVGAKVQINNYKIDSKGEDVVSSNIAPMMMAYIFGMIIYMFIIVYGNGVMSSVIDEKNSRIIEVIISSVRPFHLMMGKILGVASVAILQFAIWIVSTVLISTLITAVIGVDSSSTVMGDSDMLATVTRNLTDFGYISMVLISFLLFFIGGYLLYAAMFAAVGSAIENIQEAQQFVTPITMPLILSIVVLFTVVQSPHGDLAIWFSMIPFTSPVVMLARIAFGVPLWQVVISLAILYASFIAMTYFAAKIYRVGILMYGKKASWRQLLKWIKYT